MAINFLQDDLLNLVEDNTNNLPRNLGGIYGTDLTEAERAANIQDISKAGDTPLHSIPEFDRLQYAARDYRSMPSLYEMYLSGGFPEETIAADTAQIPGATDYLMTTGGGGGGAGTGTTIPDTDLTALEQNLINQGAGVQGAPGDPVVAPGEMLVHKKTWMHLISYQLIQNTKVLLILVMLM